MTEQEAFDKVWAHFVTNGQPVSYEAEGSGLRRRYLYPKYRDPEGHRCAIGALIPDDQYTEEMEEQHPSYVLDQSQAHLEDPMFVSALQAAHDVTVECIQLHCLEGEVERRYARYALRCRLRNLAEQYDLVVPE